MPRSGIPSLPKSNSRKGHQKYLSRNKDSWKRPAVPICRSNHRSRGRRSFTSRTNSKNSSRIQKHTLRSALIEDEVRRSLLGALNESTGTSPAQPLQSIPVRDQVQNVGRRRSLRLSSQCHRYENSSRPSLIPGASNQLIESAFADIFNRAILEAVDIDQCVSLEDLRVRPMHEFGVKRIMEMLKGRSVGMVTGHVQVGKLQVIVQLPPHYKKLASSYFVSRGRERELSDQWVSSNDIYHVVNGGFEHEARSRLAAEEGCQFGGREWRALIIPWTTEDTVRSIAMMSNQLQKKEFAIEVTFMEELVMMRRIIDDFAARGEFQYIAGKAVKRGFPEKVARKFSGNNSFTNSTVKALVGVVVKMSMATILAMKSVVDAECPSVARLTKYKAKKSPTPSDHAILDERVFRKILNSKSLRRAVKFFSLDITNEDRENALRRLCNIAQTQNCFKGVSSEALDTQIVRVVASRKEIENFTTRILRGERWPEEMLVTRRNLLETEKLDMEVEENIGNPDALLKSLRNQYINIKGPSAAARVEHYEQLLFADNDREDGTVPKERDDTDESADSQQTEVVKDTPTVTETEPTSTQPTERNSTLDQIQQSNIAEQVEPFNMVLENLQEMGSELGKDAPVDLPSLNAEDTEDRLSSGLVPSDQPAAHSSLLGNCGIEVHGISWEEYNVKVLINEDVFDFIFADPFQTAAKQMSRHMDDEERYRFIDFSRKATVPGGYVFIIVPEDKSEDWIQSMTTKGLSNTQKFFLLWDPKAVQRTKGRALQSAVEVAVVGRIPGRHPQNFTIDVDSPYSHLSECTFPRKFRVIDQIPNPINRLYFSGTKIPARIGEKPHSLLRELMTTFCPPGGRVLDPFANTLTTGIACVFSGRSCVLLEDDERCRKDAEMRLVAITKTFTDNQNRETIVNDQEIIRPEENRYETAVEHPPKALPSAQKFGSHPTPPSMDVQLTASDEGGSRSITREVISDSVINKATPEARDSGTPNKAPTPQLRPKRARTKTKRFGTQ